MTKAKSKQPIYLKDYQSPAYGIDTVELYIQLEPTNTRVRSTLMCKRNTNEQQAVDLVLNGEQLTLLSIALDGRPLDVGQDYQITANQLIIKEPPEQFELIIENTMNPEANKALTGLYISRGIFCTQCEAEGFRRITYYLDTPDVMSVFTTTLVAEKARFPLLLANGNLVEKGEYDDGRHYVTWFDPHKKPAYLFALVAGSLEKIADTYTTSSGRVVSLEIFATANQIEQCYYAMESLKAAMRWDEDAYGREYDLDHYMIVVISDFNMGAMENKGLNIFNSKYVLADPKTATDRDYELVEAVIGHEYFHNWSGNRVTLRDWFQLSLKEGFTVFREQQFSESQGAGAVKRLRDVQILRERQFAQDAGPMAHPIRPDSYIEINNFYTVTVYNKGAEVIRMLHTLLGEAGFRKGSDLYFSRHDGQAVTTDDFVACMAEANQHDLSQFKRWYEQSGTPELTIETRYDAAQARYRMTITQQCPPTYNQPTKEPFYIPLRLGLLSESGEPIPLQLEGESVDAATVERVLFVTQEKQTFEFVKVESKPQPSLLRGFSAPVNVNVDFSDEELAFLWQHDTDSFAKWEAGQKLCTGLVNQAVHAMGSGVNFALPADVLEIYRTILQDSQLDNAFKAELLSLPSYHSLSLAQERLHPGHVYAAREQLRAQIAKAHRNLLLETYVENHETNDELNALAIGKRCIKNLCLSYLMLSEDNEARALCQQQLACAKNMTDSFAALEALVLSTYDAEAEQVLAAFYGQWQSEDLVIDKWFALQAKRAGEAALARIKALMEHEAFTLENPNRARALIMGFCEGNPTQFHREDGAGYAFLAEQVLTIDAFNPQLAARLLEPFTQWHRLETTRQQAMYACLTQLQTQALSPDAFEIVERSLNYKVA